MGMPLPPKPPANAGQPAGPPPEEGAEGVDGLDPAVIEQLLQLLGVPEDASDDDIMRILEMIMSGEGLEPEAPGPQLGGAAARRLQAPPPEGPPNVPMPPAPGM